MFKYFISYNYCNLTQRGYGCTVVTTRKIIKNMKDIKEITEYIEKRWHLDQLVILNYQLMGRVK